MSLKSEGNLLHNHTPKVHANFLQSKYLAIIIIIIIFFTISASH